MIDELIDEIVRASEDVASCTMIGYGVASAKRRLEDAKAALKREIAFTYEPMPYYDTTQLVIPDSISALQDTLQIIFPLESIK